MAKRMRLAQFALAAVGLCMMTLAGTIALAKNQHHSNGHSLLGAKLNQNGKHEIGKIGNNAVTAEVNNKKVVNMSAGNLPARKVKSNKRMAGVEGRAVSRPARGLQPFRRDRIWTQSLAILPMRAH